MKRGGLIGAVVRCWVLHRQPGCFQAHGRDCPRANAEQIALMRVVLCTNSEYFYG